MKRQEDADPGNLVLRAADAFNADRGADVDDAPLEPLMTPTELAKLLHVDWRTIYNMVWEGKIPGVVRTAGKRGGRVLRFDRPKISVWLEARRRRGLY